MRTEIKEKTVRKCFPNPGQVHDDAYDERMRQKILKAHAQGVPTDCLQERFEHLGFSLRRINQILHDAREAGEIPYCRTPATLWMSIDEYA